LMSLLDLPPWTRRTWTVVGNARQDLKSRSESSLPAFQAALAAELTKREIEYRAKAGPCWFILPIKFPLDLKEGPPRVIQILGRRFAFMRIENLREYLGPATNDAEVREQIMLSEPMPPTVVCVGGEGFPIEFVFDTVAPAFDALRGAMELSLHFGQARMMVGPSEPWGRVPHPKQLFCLREGKPVDGLGFVGTPDWEPNSRLRDCDRLLESLEEVAGLIAETPAEGSIDELLGDLLRLYTQAMEQSESIQQLMGFWQMAEAMTLKKDEKGAGERVVARLSWFGQFLSVEPKDAVRIVLSSIMEKRNEAVHRGLHGQVDQQDVNMLKLVCEVGLDWLLSNRASLPTRAHLGHWWAHTSADAASLIALREVTLFIERHRATNQRAFAGALSPPL